MLRFVARVLIARQHDLCRAGVEAATIRTPVFERWWTTIAAQRVGRTENVIGLDLNPGVLVETATGPHADPEIDRHGRYRRVSRPR
jgi:hypothetical protein